ncbi:unnamed protein product, partial [Scytosiphon promiscuus]
LRVCRLLGAAPDGNVFCRQVGTGGGLDPTVVHGMVPQQQRRGRHRGSRRRLLVPRRSA